MPENFHSPDFAELDLDFQEFSEFWSKNVSGTDLKLHPKMNPAEIRTVLHTSLAPSLDAIIERHGLTLGNPDQPLPERLRAVVLKLKETSSDKWSFLPKNFESLENINCSGMTLLIGRLLERARIPYFTASPVGHSNILIPEGQGKYLYADPSVSTTDPHDLEPNLFSFETESELQFGTSKLIRFHSAICPYRLLIASPADNDVEDILGNLSQVRKEAEKGDSESRAFCQRFGLDKGYRSVDFNNLKTLLYPERNELFLSQEHLAEEERIRILREKLENL